MQRGGPASPCNKLKEEGLSMHAKPRSLTCTLTLNIYIIIDKLNGGKATGICGIYIAHRRNADEGRK